MNLLSLPGDKLRPHYDVLVIGSGYGGSIAANRFSRSSHHGKPLSIALLERGREVRPGEYPDDPITAWSELGIDTAVGKTGTNTGLFDMRIYDDMHVVVGRGLGGTSLINANAAVLPDPRVFQDPRWPMELRDEATRLLEHLSSGVSQAKGNPLAEGFARATEMLALQPYPMDWPIPKKLRVLQSMADTLNASCSRPPVAVWFGPEGPNHVGVTQSPCVGCGDCMTGCNHSAKNTLLMNYIPDAVRHGAEVFTCMEVSHVEWKADAWIVWYRRLQVGRENFEAPLSFVRADTVVLAAGALGSTEILLRSKAKGLSISDRLGQHFTGNGDVLAFGYDLSPRVNGIGTGHALPDPKDPVGPCITGLIDLRREGPLEEGIVIEEGTIPGALAGISPAVLGAAAAAVGQDRPQGWRQWLRRFWRRLESWTRGPHHGATAHTQALLVMGHDDSTGEIRLVDNRPAVIWPNVGSLPVYERIHDILRRATLAAGGTFVRNPIWSELLGKQVVTVHPLGGCAVGDDTHSGVTNHRGQVFDGRSREAVYPDLLVMDGALIPRPLGVNPLLTISALAERACALVAKERDWMIDYTLSTIAPDQPGIDRHRAGIRFTERMTGFVGSAESDYATAEQQGKETGRTAEFTITVETADIDALLDSPGHEAGISGTVFVPILSSTPMTVSDGKFALFPSETGSTRTVSYRMQLTTVEGAQFSFTGLKRLHDDPGFDVWEDATTLYFDIHETGATSTTPVTKGILRIQVEDLITQLRSISITTDTNDWLEKWKALGKVERLTEFIAGNVLRVYAN